MRDMSKVLFVKYVPHFLCGETSTNHKSLLAAASSSAAPQTVVVLKSRGNYLSIQGFPDISCKEKRQCWSSFQAALKQLLGIQPDTVICIRFSDPPCTVINNLSCILHEPNQIVHIIVTPLLHSNALSSSQTSQSKPCTYGLVDSSSQQTRGNPYCQYKEMFHTGNQPSSTGHTESPVKRKYDSVAMSRLLSELDEISSTLERTQQECDKIALRCGPAKPSPSPSCDKTPLTARDSGKGSSSSPTDHTDGLHISQEDTEDRKVERLLEVAESVTQQLPHVMRGQSDATGEEVLPDPPTGVTVQPSVSVGGVYIMWNPVRLDPSEQNHGHIVRGYLVYLDKILKAKVEGSLSSHVELLQGLEEGREYLVQVGTHTSDCNSLLSSPVKYRHTSQPTRQSQLRRARVEQQQESKSKAARVESWLLSGHISQPDVHTLANGVRGSISEGHAPLSPHVHFALGESDGHHGNKWAEQTDVGAQLVDSGCEDTRSNASSHTSGIVTDFAMSPHVKQAPVFTCLNCRYLSSADAHSLSTHVSNIHSVSDDGFHTLTHCTCLDTGSTMATKTTHSSSSTLCPSQRSSRAGSEDITMDTVIDEPLKLTPVKRSVSGEGGTRQRMLRMKPKRPEAPKGLSVYQAPGEVKWLLLEWEPVSRDSRGCSNGFFILGYRVYVNDVAQKSVDGALTCRTKIPCPTSTVRQPLRLDVRSRAMAGESVPSVPAHFSLICSSHSKKPCDVTSDVDSCGLRCPSIDSLVVTKSEGSDRTIQSCNRRVETYV